MYIAFHQGPTMKKKEKKDYKKICDKRTNVLEKIRKNFLKKNDFLIMAQK